MEEGGLFFLTVPVGGCLTCPVLRSGPSPQVLMWWCGICTVAMVPSGFLNCFVAGNRWRLWGGRSHCSLAPPLSPSSMNRCWSSDLFQCVPPDHTLHEVFWLTLILGH